jgi:hypothetical protein
LEKGNGGAMSWLGRLAERIWRAANRLESFEEEQRRKAEVARALQRSAVMVARREARLRQRDWEAGILWPRNLEP